MPNRFKNLTLNIKLVNLLNKFWSSTSIIAPDKAPVVKDDWVDLKDLIKDKAQLNKFEIYWEERGILGELVLPGEFNYCYIELDNEDPNQGYFYHLIKGSQHSYKKNGDEKQVYYYYTILYDDWVNDWLTNKVYIKGHITKTGNRDLVAQNINLVQPLVSSFNSFKELNGIAENDNVHEPAKVIYIAKSQYYQAAANILIDEDLVKHKDIVYDDKVIIKLLYKDPRTYNFKNVLWKELSKLTKGYKLFNVDKSKLQTSKLIYKPNYYAIVPTTQDKYYYSQAENTSLKVNNLVLENDLIELDALTYDPIIKKELNPETFLDVLKTWFVKTNFNSIRYKYFYRIFEQAILKKFRHLWYGDNVRKYINLSFNKEDSTAFKGHKDYDILKNVDRVKGLNKFIFRGGIVEIFDRLINKAPKYKTAHVTYSFWLDLNKYNPGNTSFNRGTYTGFIQDLDNKQYIFARGVLKENLLSLQALRSTSIFIDKPDFFVNIGDTKNEITNASEPIKVDFDAKFLDDYYTHIRSKNNAWLNSLLDGKAWVDYRGNLYNFEKDWYFWSGNSQYAVLWDYKFNIFPIQSDWIYLNDGDSRKSQYYFKTTSKSFSPEKAYIASGDKTFNYTGETVIYHSKKGNEKHVEAIVPKSVKIEGLLNTIVKEFGNYKAVVTKSFTDSKKFREIFFKSWKSNSETNKGAIITRIGDKFIEYTKPYNGYLYTYKYNFDVTHVTSETEDKTGFPIRSYQSDTLLFKLPLDYYNWKHANHHERKKEIFSADDFINDSEWLAFLNYFETSNEHRAVEAYRRDSTVRDEIVKKWDDSTRNFIDITLKQYILKTEPQKYTPLNTNLKIPLDVVQDIDLYDLHNFLPASLINLVFEPANKPNDINKEFSEENFKSAVDEVLNKIETSFNNTGLLVSIDNKFLCRFIYSINKWDYELIPLEDIVSPKDVEIYDFSNHKPDDIDQVINSEFVLNAFGVDINLKSKFIEDANNRLGVNVKVETIKGKYDKASEFKRIVANLPVDFINATLEIPLNPVESSGSTIWEAKQLEHSITQRRQQEYFEIQNQRLQKETYRLETRQEQETSDQKFRQEIEQLQLKSTLGILNGVLGIGASIGGAITSGNPLAAAGAIYGGINTATNLLNTNLKFTHLTQDKNLADTQRKERITSSLNKFDINSENTANAYKLNAKGDYINLSKLASKIERPTTTAALIWKEFNAKHGLADLYIKWHYCSGDFRRYISNYYFNHGYELFLPNQICRGVNDIHRHIQFSEVTYNHCTHQTIKEFIDNRAVHGIKVIKWNYDTASEEDVQYDIHGIPVEHLAYIGYKKVIIPSLEDVIFNFNTETAILRGQLQQEQEVINKLNQDVKELTLKVIAPDELLRQKEIYCSTRVEEHIKEKENLQNQLNICTQHAHELSEAFSKKVEELRKEQEVVKLYLDQKNEAIAQKNELLKQKEELLNRNAECANNLAVKTADLSRVINEKINLNNEKKALEQQIKELQKRPIAIDDPEIPALKEKLKQQIKLFETYNRPLVLKNREDCSEINKNFIEGINYLRDRRYFGSRKEEHPPITQRELDEVFNSNDKVLSNYEMVQKALLYMRVKYYGGLTNAQITQALDNIIYEYYGMYMPTKVALVVQQILLNLQNKICPPDIDHAERNDPNITVVKQQEEEIKGFKELVIQGALNNKRETDLKPEKWGWDYFLAKKDLWNKRPDPWKAFETEFLTASNAMGLNKGEFDEKGWYLYFLYDIQRLLGWTQYKEAEDGDDFALPFMYENYPWDNDQILKRFYPNKEHLIKEKWFDADGRKRILLLQKLIRKTIFSIVEQIMLSRKTSSLDIYALNLYKDPDTLKTYYPQDKLWKNLTISNWKALFNHNQYLGYLIIDGWNTNSGYDAINIADLYKTIQLNLKNLIKKIKTTYIERYVMSSQHNRFVLSWDKDIDHAVLGGLWRSLKWVVDSKTNKAKATAALFKYDINPNEPPLSLITYLILFMMNMPGGIMDPLQKRQWNDSTKRYEKAKDDKTWDFMSSGGKIKWDNFLYVMSGLLDNVKWKARGTTIVQTLKRDQIQEYLLRITNDKLFAAWADAIINDLTL